MKRTLLIIGVVFICAAALAPLAGAFGAVDQAQPYADGTIVMPPGIAQTFTAGKAGRLDGFTLTTPTAAPVVLQVYAVRADGKPDITRPLLPSNQSIGLRAGANNIAVPAIPVSKGTKLALRSGRFEATRKRVSRSGSETGIPQASSTRCTERSASTLSRVPTSLSPPM